MMTNNLSKSTIINLICLVLLNIILIPLTWLLLRIIFKPKQSDENEQLIKDENPSLVINDINKEKTSTNIRYIHEGECAGDYSKKWTSTFDIVFLIIMIIYLIVISIITFIYVPSIWFDWIFWLKQLLSFVIITLTLFCGGLICRYYCQIDDKGYIITNRSSHFKVNYTKKLHHFVIYLSPLILSTKSHDSILSALIHLCWGTYISLLTSLVLIKPLREKSKFLMIQFNCMDRPEDRPHTLFWVIACNNIPGYIITIFYRWLYQLKGLDLKLVFIFTLINTIGDGLAEPIGIYFGKHRYKTKGCFNKTMYERSFEGSSCVFISSVIIISIFWYAFQNFLQVWITIIILPLTMSITEALSPHTCDAGFIKGIGGLIVFIIGYFGSNWI